MVSGEMSEADLQAKIDAMRDAKVERLIAERLEGFRKDLERS